MNTNTPQQDAAIAARGNVLVVAGAGSGKTRTLVERCLACLLDDNNPVAMDQILMVTFTEAAAAEMRQRLRARLEEANATETLGLLETAWIGTLHSFCLQLVRENFYALGLDPQLTVLPEERAHLLSRQAMDQVFNAAYAGETPEARAIQELIQMQGDTDKPTRELVRRIHTYTQTLPNPAGWLEGQTRLFEQAEPPHWLAWMMQVLAERRQNWTEEFEEHHRAQEAKVLKDLPAKATRAEFAAGMGEILRIADEAKPKDRKPVETILDEIRFLLPLCAVGKSDPLQEDWGWSAPAMRALLDLTRQFGAAFREAKREAGGMDFHDLEQYALQLLRDPATQEPSAVAAQWRKKLRLIFVDEYQDINHAQEAILSALGREDAEGNRFLVGDVKQSIYRFRLTDPRIFLKYHAEWRAQSGTKVIELSDNFRSQPGILDFVNEVFRVLMRREVGGIDYDEGAQLRVGNKTSPHAPGPRVEFHLRRTKRRSETVGDQPSPDTEQEARLAARRLRELKDQEIFPPGQPPRPATWSDMVILLRSPRKKAEAYAKEFARQGIPLSADRGGFYEGLEVRDLLGMLQVLDNPSQDLPLIAVLRSPLVGLKAEELAAIRLARRPARFWEALQRWHEQNPGHERVQQFLERHARWRRMSRRAGVSPLLETIVEETGYAKGLTPEAQSNLSRLLYLTLQFDRARGESLYRFLQHLDTQMEHELDVEPAAQPLRDAVRLMSIHKSKGLEFPIVVLPDLGKRFNLEDARARVILDEEFGLCPQVRPPEVPRFYPSLPHWLAQRRQQRETRGEELRLLYVAMTRAADRLILIGSVGGATIKGKWQRSAQRGPGPAEMMAGQNYLDWLGPWFLARHGADSLETSGENSLLTWRLYDEPLSAMDAPIQAKMEDLEPSKRQKLARALADERYAHFAATRRVAKSSVSALRREEEDDEAEIVFTRMDFARPEKIPGNLSAADVGSAHHAFLEAVSLAKLGGIADLKREAERLREEKVLTEAEVACLDFAALARFWASEVGRQILAKRDRVRRELPFTARFSLGEIGNAEGLSQDEFIVVQGKVDLAVVLPEEIWVLDFKTDQMSANDVPAKAEFHRRQLTIYAQALSRIYGRPVTRLWLHFLTVGQTVPLPT